MQDQNLWGVILGLAFLPFTANHLQKAISFSNSVVWFFLNEDGSTDVSGIFWSQLIT